MSVGKSWVSFLCARRSCGMLWNPLQALSHIFFSSFFSFLSFSRDAQNQRPVVALAALINETIDCRFGQNLTNCFLLQKERERKKKESKRKRRSEEKCALSFCDRVLGIPILEWFLDVFHDDYGVVSTKINLFPFFFLLPLRSLCCAEQHGASRACGSSEWKLEWREQEMYVCECIHYPTCAMQDRFKATAFEQDGVLLWCVRTLFHCISFVCFSFGPSFGMPFLFEKPSMPETNKSLMSWDH